MSGTLIIDDKIIYTKYQLDSDQQIEKVHGITRDSQNYVTAIPIDYFLVGKSITSSTSLNAPDTRSNTFTFLSDTDNNGTPRIQTKAFTIEMGTFIDNMITNKILNLGGSVIKEDAGILYLTSSTGYIRLTNNSNYNIQINPWGGMTGLAGLTVGSASVTTLLDAPNITSGGAATFNNVTINGVSTLNVATVSGATTLSTTLINGICNFKEIVALSATEGTKRQIFSSYYNLYGNSAVESYGRLWHTGNSFYIENYVNGGDIICYTRNLSGVGSFTLAVSHAQITLNAPTVAINGTVPSLITTNSRTTNLTFNDETIQTTAMTTAYLTSFIQNTLGSIIPVGTILPFSGEIANGVPTGFYWCWGETRNIVDSQNLFNVIGHRYANGQYIYPGTYYLPDLRGAFLKGCGSTNIWLNVDAIGATGSTQQCNVGDHAHAYTDRGVDTKDVGAGAGTQAVKSSNDSYWTDGNSYHSTTHALLSAETRPNSVGINYMIKY